MSLQCYRDIATSVTFALCWTSSWRSWVIYYIYIMRQRLSFFCIMLLLLLVALSFFKDPSMLKQAREGANVCSCRYQNGGELVRASKNPLFCRKDRRDENCHVSQDPDPKSTLALTLTLLLPPTGNIFCSHFALGVSIKSQGSQTCRQAARL